MFGIGMPEMLLICAIALIVIGPKKLPDLAKSLGRAFGEFKRATSDLKESLEIDTDLSDVSKPFDEIAGDVKDSLDSPADQTANESSETDLQENNDEKQGSEHAESDSTDTADTFSDNDTDTDTPPEPVEGTNKDDRV
ncbi:MAG TPA: twin-arginine translocase TatA/TatE family subunit [Deltaproteobacteria bacterium]|nr:twin-arginine translocase TatA/TatE family subunit [Deltaproteobacteria bacterium]